MPIQTIEPDFERARESHAGRGPRCYRRSDERILEDVNERLMWHPEIDATDIEVKVRDGIVTLSGSVDERRTRRLAEDVVADVSGVNDVANDLRVGWRGAGVEREAAVRAGREERAPQEGTEIRRATRSSTTKRTARS